jgi:hypothetical protein
LTARALLLMTRVTGGKRLNELPVPEARKAALAQIPKRRKSVPLASVTNLTIPGPAGDIRVRLHSRRNRGPSR